MPRNVTDSLTTSQLIRLVGRQQGMKERQAARIVKGMIRFMVAQLQDGVTVFLPPLGSFETRRRASRTGVNPKTRERILIKGKRIPVFKPGNGLS